MLAPFVWSMGRTWNIMSNIWQQFYTEIREFQEWLFGRGKAQRLPGILETFSGKYYSGKFDREYFRGKKIMIQSVACCYLICSFLYIYSFSLSFFIYMATHMQKNKTTKIVQTQMWCPVNKNTNKHNGKHYYFNQWLLTYNYNDAHISPNLGGKN